MNQNMTPLKIIEQNCNSKIMLLRSLFLRSLSLIYLIAFSSLYFQIQGLFGDEGIYPAKNLLNIFAEHNKNSVLFLKLPTLLWFSKYISSPLQFIFVGLNSFSNVEITMFILCLIGIFISFTILVNIRFFYSYYGFALLWLLYLSFFLVGQIFLDYQWDRLLLEVGFLAIFLAPKIKKELINISLINEAVLHLLRFLLFRVIFSFGVHFHTSSSKQWQNLTVLTTYFQNQAFPNIFSYICHNILNINLMKVIAALVLVIQVIN